jgi:hypothetical protein
MSAVEDLSTPTVEGGLLGLAILRLFLVFTVGWKSSFRLPEEPATWSEGSCPGLGPPARDD